MKSLAPSAANSELSLFIQRELTRQNLKGNVPSISQKIEAILSSTNHNTHADTLAYQGPFWIKRLVLDPKAQLHIDPEPHQVFYSTTDRAIAFTTNKLVNQVLSLMPDDLMWRTKVGNIHKLTAAFHEYGNALRKNSNAWNIILLANHIHPGDVPLLAYLLNAGSGFAPAQISLVVGPLIFASKFELSAARKFANLIKTFPDTKNADTGWAWITTVRTAMSKHLIRTMKSHAQEGPKIVIMCPSGTHDQRESSGNYVMTPPSQSTPYLISALGKSNPDTLVVPIGIHGSMPLRTMGVPMPRNVTITMGKSERADAWGVDAVLRGLPSCVQDHTGKVRARWA